MKKTNVTSLFKLIYPSKKIFVNVSYQALALWTTKMGSMNSNFFVPFKERHLSITIHKYVLPRQSQDYFIDMSI